jgi:tRNA pseudouridine13 synthase
VKLKQRPEDFVVREGFKFDDTPDGKVFVYRMDKQKVSTLAALERIGKEFGVRRKALSVAGLKDKQGRTEQLVGVEGGSLGEGEVVQSGDLRLTLIGRSHTPIGTHNITANRFEVTVRDLTEEEALRVPGSVKEVERAGVVNYFDSQRFGFLKHGQGFIARHLLKGDWEAALKAFLATPSELDKSDDAKVKAFWNTHWGDWRKHAPHEAGKKYAPILRRLREDPQDFKGAFMHIETRQRTMALFELQSFVWNEGVKRYLSSQLPSGEMLGLRYQAGALLFPRSLTPEQRRLLHAKTFPLLAHDSTFDDEEIRTAALAALSAQQLSLGSFQIPDAPSLFFKHEERPMFVVPGKLRVNEPRPDELNRGKRKVNLSFTLPPGAYATLVVRRVLWFCVEGARHLGTHGQEVETRLPGKKLAHRAPIAAPEAAPGPQRQERSATAGAPALGAKSKPAKVKSGSGKPSFAWGRPLGEGGAPAAGDGARQEARRGQPAQGERTKERTKARPQREEQNEPRPAEQQPSQERAAEPETMGKQGFLARQRAKKEERAKRRALDVQAGKRSK